MDARGNKDENGRQEWQIGGCFVFTGYSTSAVRLAFIGKRQSPQFMREITNGRICVRAPQFFARVCVCVCVCVCAEQSNRTLTGGSGASRGCVCVCVCAEQRNRTNTGGLLHCLRLCISKCFARVPCVGGAV